VLDGLLGCVTVVCDRLRGRAAPPPCREVIFRMVLKFSIFFFFSLYSIVLGEFNKFKLVCECAVEGPLGSFCWVEDGRLRRPSVDVWIRQEGVPFWRGPRALWLRSAAPRLCQRRTASKRFPQRKKVRNSSARARGWRGGGGEWMVLGSGGGGWFLRGMVLQFFFFRLVFLSVYIQKKKKTFVSSLFKSKL
jgi:hypothetical protein